ncbi:hypothetical protein SAMN02745135_02586 [Caloranaerobacter azorensis DSM 13643]|uniref:Uncharacterized protein n=1 Tax=Caloranaerobacter azorensis DSM 13643 TaxID=1121264 RepID=A0A1M5WPJ0_9FIRM|nr:hypothetical protein SAMN02745135_02586 [Caloranaerobacter azorensis DSM 13643]
MIGVIFLRVYLSEKDSKILLFLGLIIGIAGVFFCASKILNKYSSALFVTIVYVINSSEIFMKTIFKR